MTLLQVYIWKCYTFKMHTTNSIRLNILNYFLQNRTSFSYLGEDSKSLGLASLQGWRQPEEVTPAKPPRLLGKQPAHRGGYCGSTGACAHHWECSYHTPGVVTGENSLPQVTFWRAHAGHGAHVCMCRHAHTINQLRNVIKNLEDKQTSMLSDGKCYKVKKPKAGPVRRLSR